MAKRYEELTISDDFIFGKAMGDKVLCHDVLERMLEKRVGTLEDIQPQREFQYAVDGKPVRLDMYARDRKSYRELPEEIQIRWRSWMIRKCYWQCRENME